MIPFLRWGTGGDQEIVTLVEFMGFMSIFLGGPLGAKVKTRIKQSLGTADVWCFRTVINLFSQFHRVL
jgi:hypothetical protein